LGFGVDFGPTVGVDFGPTVGVDVGRAVGVGVVWRCLWLPWAEAPTPVANIPSAIATAASSAREACLVLIRLKSVLLVIRVSTRCRRRRCRGRGDRAVWTQGCRRALQVQTRPVKLHNQPCHPPVTKATSSSVPGLFGGPWRGVAHMPRGARSPTRRPPGAGPPSAMLRTQRPSPPPWKCAPLVHCSRECAAWRGRLPSTLGR
jgi:hypothetical protein